MKKRALILTAANNKGGCGKTTTAIAVAAEMAARGLAVLLIDIDSQSNATASMPDTSGGTTYDMLQGKKVTPTTIAHNLHGIGSSKDMAAAEVDFAGLQTGNALKEALTPYMAQYDCIVIDTPPATGLLTINALIAADFILLPLQTSLYGVQGMERLFELLQKFGKADSTGIVLTMYDGRKNVHRQLREMVARYNGAALFTATIRNCIAVVEAPLAGALLRDYAPKATATQDYAALTDEILQRTAKK